MPRRACMTAAIRNKIINTTKIRREISTDTAAILLKPRTAAISAMTRNVMAHCNMLLTLSHEVGQEPRAMAAHK